MKLFPFFRDREVTSVGIESEIIIPWKTYTKKCLGGIIFIVGAFIVGMFAWLYDFLGTGTLKEWLPLWAAWMKRHWPLIPLLCVLWCITYPLLIFMFRMTIEQVFKAWLPVNLWGKWFGKIDDDDR